MVLCRDRVGVDVWGGGSVVVCHIIRTSYGRRRGWGGVDSEVSYITISDIA